MAIARPLDLRLAAAWRSTWLSTPSAQAASNRPLGPGLTGKGRPMFPPWHDDRFVPALAVFAVVGCAVTLIIKWVASWF